MALGSQIPLSGLKHGPGTWPSNPASPRHGRHAQEREATQVPGPRRLLRKRWARGRGVERRGWKLGWKAPWRVLACLRWEGGWGPLGTWSAQGILVGRKLRRDAFSFEGWYCVSVTVADYANSDPAVVRSGRVKKAVANAVQQEVKSLCGLEASQVPAVEALSGAGEPCDIIDSSGETDAQEESIHERTISRKKKSKRHREDLNGTGGEEYPMDIWLLLASYIRPEDIVNFSLICKNAWTVTCTAAFWTRLYRRCDHRKLTMLSMWLISLFLI